MAQLTGTIFDIRKYSVHDGPGIRTTVFFKGCWLRCFWCHNPEGLRGEVEIQFSSERCLGCGECVKVCPTGAQQMLDGVHIYDRSLCTQCGDCLDTCYTGALEKTGEQVTVEKVMQEILQDQAFYRQSGGGVTLSGGDPLLQLKFTLALLSACKQAGLHTALETAANCRWEILEEVLPLTDLVLMDLKHIDPARHRAGTGVSNERILANAARLAASSTPVLFRTPVIPGINDTPEEIGAIAAFVKHIYQAHPANSQPQLDLLPFHRLAAGKYHSLGLEYRSETLSAPTAAHMQRLADAVTAQGVQVHI